jgi:hypothetical protein
MLTELEQAKTQWKQRVQAWQAERATLNPADAALRQRRFSAEEQGQLDAAEQRAVSAFKATRRRAS